MVAVLKVLRQYEQLSDATLTQALIQAIFAASIKSPDPTEVTLQAFQEFAEQQLAKDKTGGQPPTSIEALFELRGGYYEGTKIDLERHGKIAHLAPGDELTFHGNMTPNAIYESFVRVLLREIARALGVTFEEMTGDFSNATYSSVRMATLTIWGIVLGLPSTNRSSDSGARNAKPDRRRSAAHQFAPHRN
jgi:capsid protein